MSSKKLTTAIREAAEECGYEFHAGQQYRMDAQIVRTPAVWLLPLRLEKVEGRTRGVCHYKATVHLLHDCPDHATEAKEALWNRMEADAMRICTLMCGDERVKSASATGCTAAEFTLTNRGELSLTVDYSVQVPFTDINDCKE